MKEGVEVEKGGEEVEKGRGWKWKREGEVKMEGEEVEE